MTTDINELKRLMDAARQDGVTELEVEAVETTEGGLEHLLPGVGGFTIPSDGDLHNMLTAGMVTNMSTVENIEEDTVTVTTLLNFGEEQHGLDAEYFNVNYGLSLLTDQPTLVLCIYSADSGVYGEVIAEFTKHDSDKQGLVLRSHYGPSDFDMSERIFEIIHGLEFYKDGFYQNVYLANGEFLIEGNGPNKGIEAILDKENSEWTTDEVDRIADFFYQWNNAGHYPIRETHLMYNIEDCLRLRPFNTKIIMSSLQAQMQLAVANSVSDDQSDIDEE